MPDYGLGYGLGLRGGAAELGAYKVEGEEAAVKFEGEACGAEVGVRRANVVEEAS